MARFFVQLGQVLVLLLSILPASVKSQDLGVSDFRKVFPTTPPTRARVNEKLPLFAILMDFPDQPHKLTRQEIHQMLFASEKSVTDYFDWVSGGKFVFEQAGPGTVGWHTAPKTQNDYSNNIENGTNVRRADSIRVANEDFSELDLAGLDENGDKVITANELAVVLIWAGNTENSASVRASEPQEIDIGRGYSINMPLLAIYENRIGTFAGGGLSPATVAHEISHVAFGLGDEYEGKPGNTTTESLCGFSLMANETTLNNRDGVPILDAWSLFQLGWIDARLATEATCFQLGAVEHDHDAIVVPIYGKGVEEYFIVENRFPAGTYNGGFASGSAGVDQGIAVWHIDETIKNDGIINHRRAIRLMRATGPVPAITCQVNQQPVSLFDASDPATGYALSDSSNPRNTKTRDGSSTGIEISSIPQQGATVTVYIRNPYNSIASKIATIEAEMAPLKDRLKLLERLKQSLRAQRRAGDITESSFRAMTASITTKINSTSAEIDVRASRLARVESDIVAEFASLPVRNGCN